MKTNDVYRAAVKGESVRTRFCVTVSLYNCLSLMYVPRCIRSMMYLSLSSCNAL